MLKLYSSSPNNAKPRALAATFRPQDEWTDPTNKIMNEIIHFFETCKWWEFLLGIIGIAIFIRIVYEILTDK
jgi:hypothetical protein